MNILLTINETHQAMLLYDQKLDFAPAWVEFAQDGRGVRIIGEDGREYIAGVTVDARTLEQLHNVNDILLVQMKNGTAIEGTLVTFVNQYYDGRKRPEGANNAGGWYTRDD